MENTKRYFLISYFAKSVHDPEFYYIPNITSIETLNKYPNYFDLMKQISPEKEKFDVRIFNIIEISEKDYLEFGL